MRDLRDVMVLGAATAIGLALILGPGIKMRPLSATAYNIIPVGGCPTAAPGEVTFFIDDPLDGLSAPGKGQRVRRSIVWKATGQPVSQINPQQLGSRWRTNLDMDVTDPTKPYVRVNIIVTSNRGIRFLRPAAPAPGQPMGTDSSNAVMVENVSSGGFCGRTAIASVNLAGPPPGRTGEKVTFGILPGTGVTGMNVGLLIPTTPVTGQPFEQEYLPIFLDPNMKNEG